MSEIRLKVCCSLLRRYKLWIFGCITLIIIIVITCSVPGSQRIIGIFILLLIGFIFLIIFVSWALLMICQRCINCFVPNEGVTDENNNSLHQDIQNNQAL